jgi:putative phosphoribosyl transferase
MHVDHEGPSRFRDRRAAGRALARALEAYRGRPDALVLGLPRGGLVVAYEVAHALGLPLDVMIVRKLGVPGHAELALGAIASGGARVLNDEVIRSLRVASAAIEQVATREQTELERRERAYRGVRPALDARGRCILLVDDGAATGATMRAAVAALRMLGPARVVVGLPTAARDACAALRREADEVCCLVAPAAFAAVGEWYEEFGQSTDEEVCALLAESRSEALPQ